MQCCGMLEGDFLDSLGPIIHTKHLLLPGHRSEFFARARRGEFISLFRGVHVRADHWQSLDRHEKYRVRVLAVVRDDPTAVVSHESAAALWRLPAVGAWPDRVHVLAARATGGRSSVSTVRHAVGIPVDVVTIDRARVTTLARTVIDLCRTSPFPDAVAVADAALRRSANPVVGVPRTTLEAADLRRELAGVPARLGSARASRVIEFASPLADRPGESLSRVSMHLAGVEAPELQVEIRGRSGRRYVADFWWPRFTTIGEFDGKGKYSDPEFLRGRTPAQALLDEKAREDDLRATGRGMSRWGWAIAVSPQRLQAHLAAAGVH